MTNSREGTVTDQNPNCYGSTSEIFDRLQIKTQTKPELLYDPPTETLESWYPGQSFIDIPPAPLLPATLKESDLIFFSNSDDIKTATGVKNSAHSVEIVSYPDGECDFLFSPFPSQEMELKQLNDNPDKYGNARYAYLMTVDRKFYYLDKQLRLPIPIPLYDLVMMSELLNNEEKNTEFGKVYISTKGEYIFRDFRGNLQKGKINPEKLNIDNLEKKINQPEFKTSLLQQTSKEGHIFPLNDEKIKKLYDEFKINSFTNNENFICCKNDISREDIQKINDITGHIDCKGFLKRNEYDPIMAQAEPAAGFAFQILGSRNFPTYYAVRNDHNQDVGVFSKELAGFIPNRDKPLEASDLTINSLKNMIKKRNENEENAIKEVFGIVKPLLTLLDRSPYWFDIYSRTKNCLFQYLGNPYKAINIAKSLQKLCNKNAATVTFGKLESLRQLLINRRKEIKSVEGKRLVSQHEHDKELPEIDKAIEKLNHILLDEIALYMKEMKKIDKKLQENWVDIEAEELNPNSKYKNLQISEGLIGPIDVKLEDIRRFRIHCGQAIGLTASYFREDPDCHNRNIGFDGKRIDFDNAIKKFSPRYVCPSRKESTFDYNVEDFIEFPNLTHAPNIWYWVTKPRLSDQSADALLSLTCDMTQNFFKSTDNDNYANLANSPVFSFQKYIQLVIETLLNKKIFTAFAELHFNDDLPMIKEDGNPDILLPLYDANGCKQDARSFWIKCLSQRAEEAKTKLALKLIPLKNILERQSDFVLDCVLETFQMFLDDKKVEFKNKKEALDILENAINLDEIKKEFYALKEQILNPPQDEFINHIDSVVINMSTIPYPEAVYEDYSPSQSNAPRFLG